jgi:cell fate regulator YaaT (PSP1 superfamily)
MPIVVGVAFRRCTRAYWFDPGPLEPAEGADVVVETAKGLDIGHVRIAPTEVAEADLQAPLKRVVRLATKRDLDSVARNRDRAARALQVCGARIRHHRLPMKPLTADFAFDSSQVTVYFSADTRVDFRDLVKDVAGQLRCRVQLLQVGARDQAKMLGGVGTCGRELCCSSFMTDFMPVSMRMAKDQSLFLNPAKFSGACGKLMCCLRYEHEVYVAAKRILPPLGASIETPVGKGRVVGLQMLREQITVQLDDAEAAVVVAPQDCTWQARHAANHPIDDDLEGSDLED